MPRHRIVKVEALLVSVFLVGVGTNVECFAPPSASLEVSAAGHRRIARNRHASSMPSHAASTTWTHRSRSITPWLLQSSRHNCSRKRPRTLSPSRLTVGDDGAETSADTAELNDVVGRSNAVDNLPLPPRLRAMVENLDRQPDLCSKSKLLVHMGDAFSLTGAYCANSPLTSSSSSLSNEGAPPSKQPPPPPPQLHKVPGCVSEVHVAVDVRSRDGGGGGCGSVLPSESSELTEDTTRMNVEREIENTAYVSICGSADARVSRGILALLSQGLEGESPATVLGLRGKDLAIAVGMRAGLTSSRINGLGNMLSVIQREVWQQQQRLEEQRRPPPSPKTAAVTATVPDVKVATMTPAKDEDEKNAANDDCVNEVTFSTGVYDDADTHADIGAVGEDLGSSKLHTPPVIDAAAAVPGPSPFSSSPLPRNEFREAPDPAMEAKEGEYADLSRRSGGYKTDAHDRGALDLGLGERKETKKEEATRWTPLPGSEDEVAVLLSGGVDSSVALRLLQDQGYRVRAFYLKIWLEDELAHLGECPWVRLESVLCV